VTHSNESDDRAAARAALPDPPVSDLPPIAEAMDAPATGVQVRKAAVAFIFITVLLDILAFGMIIPVLPHLIASFLGGNVSKAALWYGSFSAFFNLMQFVFSPIQGALSDRFGRRKVILLSNFGLGVDFLFMALVSTLPLLFIGRLVSGITSASFSTAGAYIADVTPPQKRAQAFGMIGMAFGIGFVVAPAIGGVLGEVHPRLPFWIAACLSLANFCYGFFVLPESLPLDRRAPFRWSKANPLASLRLLRSHHELFGLATVLLLMQFAHFVYPSTFVLYADYRFHWNSGMVGYTLAFVGVLAAIVQGGLIKRFIARFGERRTLMIGLACGTLGFTLYGLAPNGYWFWAAMPIAALWGISAPSAQAIMTHHVSPNEQGRLQGAISSLTSIAGIFAPFAFTHVFAAITATRPGNPWVGATFWMAGMLVLMAAIIARRTTTRLHAQ
jgi:DHA1 family tetracycline resistance protein-like MFS transporter